MANTHGDWIWYELMSPDAAASAAFYAPLLGWMVGDQPDYREILGPTGEGIGGMLQITPDMAACGCVAAWVGYVSVDDVDAAVSGIAAAGGKVLMPARDMPGVGRFAMVADCCGAPFYVMTPTPPVDQPDAVSTAFAKYTPKDGHCAWNELAASDPDAALAFYGGQFGWSKDGEMDMGPMGTYSFIKNDAVIGAIMPTMPGMPVSAWAFYFRVPDIGAAAAHIAATGGQVIRGPEEVPGGDFSLNAIDPQGAHFALVGRK